MPSGRVIGVEELRDIGSVDLSWVDPDRAYAVRSSASVEDGNERSFAGQFATVLNARGVDAVREALRTVADSASSAGAAAYAREAGAQPIRMAAIVQEMVPSVAAGVAFSRNPVSGLEEVVVEAVRGSGDALVQEGVTPSRWIDRYGALTVRPDADAPLADDVVLAIGHEVRAVAECGMPTGSRADLPAGQSVTVRVVPVAAATFS